MDMKQMRAQIKHVVVVMLENRSFDNLLGWLYDTDETSGLKHVPPLKPGEPPFHGLAGQDLKKLANSVGNLTVPPGRGVPVLFSPQYDPHEPYLHVNVQLFEQEKNPAPGTTPTMKGFLSDYATKWPTWDWDKDKDQIAEVMDCFMPAEAPVLNGLARFYAVSDLWYSSVPTQTNCNRAFANCGTSEGRTDNQGTFGEGKPFDSATIWNAMEAAKNESWRVYYLDTYPPITGTKCYTQYLFPKVGDTEHDPHFRKFGQFANDITGNDLPAYTFIEPQWTYRVGSVGQQGTDYHPPGGTTPGEVFLKSIYLALTANEELWKQTLLVVTFDEHGGTYDHYPPPGAIPPWGEGGKPPPVLEHDFKFDRFGVRVPTLFVSPWVERDTVLRADDDKPSFDHTSIIATVLDWQEIPRDIWTTIDKPNYLGARATDAPTFEGVLNAAAPRSDNLFAPISVSGNELGYTDRFWLQHVNSDWWLGPAETHLGEWYPLLYRDIKVKIYVECPGRSGAVRSGDIVKIKTTEKEVKNYDTLGAWETSHWVYWYVDDQYKGKEQWQILRKDGKLGPLRYGDEVYILNTFISFTRNWDGYGLQNDLKYPTWLSALWGRQPWKIAKP